VGGVHGGGGAEVIESAQVHCAVGLQFINGL
jgi:hypothetical protein